MVYLSYYALPRTSVKNPLHGVESSPSERLGTACHQFDNVWVHTQPSPLQSSGPRASDLTSLSSRVQGTENHVRHTGGTQCRLDEEEIKVRRRDGRLVPPLSSSTKPVSDSCGSFSQKEG